MESREYSSAQEVHSPSHKEINKARRKFSRLVRHLPQESQDFLSEVTNMLTEPDVYREFKADSDRIQSFYDELGQMGINDNNRKIIMDYFNLPYEAKV